MATIRVHKTKNYTVMSNTHLRDKELSLKAKGLLSVMLSLPDNWDYSIAGLVAISKENETAVKSALNELRDNNYVIVTKENPTKSNGGRIKYSYEVYEEPYKQNIEKQGVENLGVEFQGVENHGQLNTNRLSTEELNTDRLNTNKKDYTSTSVDGEVYTSFLDKTTQSKIIPADLEIKKFRMINRFADICDCKIGDPILSEHVKKGFKMYVQLYEEHFHKVHPILTDKTLERVCYALSSISDIENQHFESKDIYETDDNGIQYFYKMVCDYFSRSHDGKTNYSIAHFANEKYLCKMANRFIEY